MLAGLLAGLRERLPGARVVVLSADPAATAAMHGVEAQPRSPLWVWRGLRGARLLISGGGSLVQDVTSARSALYYLGAMLAASWRGVPLAVVGQGIGPLRRPWIRFLARKAFARAQMLGVRDGDSARTLSALGVGRMAHVDADLAVLLPPAPPARAVALLTRAGMDVAVPRLGVAVRPWPTLAGPGTLGAALCRVAARCGAQVAVLPFDIERDRAASAALAAAAGGHVVEATSPSDLLALIGAMDLVLAVRLHALVFAAVQAVPAVALAYDPKVAAFAAERGLPAALPVDVTAEALEQALVRAWEGRQETAVRLRADLPALRQAAAAGLDRVVSLLG